ncbi:MAG: amidohydrolase [Desulfobacterales bacterium]|nr:amidohydrolase [Desulfobacterales bacterium]
MRIDMHIHSIGSGRDIKKIDEDIYFNADDNNEWFTRLLYNMVEGDLEHLGADFNRDGRISTNEYFELIYTMLAQSEEIDGVVLLALDAVYSSKTGELDEQKTDLWVSNRFLHRAVIALNERLNKESDPAKKKKRFFFGASISPNRKDWEQELEYVATQTNAVLVKLIPSAQHINLMDDSHTAFYRALASHHLPLLCHVGPEYAFPEGIHQKQLDNFRYLEKPLEYGVTAIAAHCAAPVFPLIEKPQIKEFYAFMKAANGDGTVRLWADTSALSLSTRVFLIAAILETFPAHWLVHGSDFPIFIDGWAHLPWVTHGMKPEEYIRIWKTKNPLDKDVRVKQAHGFSDTILENAEKILRL